MPMLTSEFQINLSEPIKPGKVSIGYFDGNHPSIVAVTRSDKIFVHNPHNRSVYDPKTTTNTTTTTTPTSSSIGNESNNGLRLVTNFTTNNPNDLDFLNINQTITCIGTGSISTLSTTTTSTSASTLNDISGLETTFKDSKSTSIRKLSKSASPGGGGDNHDILLIGTKTSIHAYDVLHNQDLFYKEIPDGANTILIGEFGGVTSDGQKLSLIGGNCAIHGFDRNGLDSYWMVTGDNITAMTLVDLDLDGKNELVVGSEDNEIQVFKKDAIILELNETDSILSLCSLGPQLFAYALKNGTVGVYRNRERLWRIKSKNQPITLLAADINNNGQMELLTGWSNGKLDIRIAETGEVLYRENYKTSIAGLMLADYNMDGLTELIVCTVSGDVYGYRLDNQQSSGSSDQSSIINPALMNVNLNIEQETIRELMKKRQTLLQELRNYEENARIKNLADPLVMNRGKVLTEKGDRFGAIPANTKLKSSLILQQQFNNNSSVPGGFTYPDFIELRLETTNKTSIRLAIIFAEGIFKNESIVIYPSSEQQSLSSNWISCPLKPPKDVPIDMHIKTLVGQDLSSLHYHVFELSRRLPRFSMYSFVKLIYLNQQDEEDGNGGVNFEGGTQDMSRSLRKDPRNKNNLKKKGRHEDDEDEESMLFDGGGHDTFDDNYFINDNFYPQQDDNNFTSGRVKRNGNNTLQRNFKLPEVHQPESFVLISLNETLGSVVEWLQNNFLLDIISNNNDNGDGENSQQQQQENEEERRFEFISLRNKLPLIFEFHHRGCSHQLLPSSISSSISSRKDSRKNSKKKKKVPRKPKSNILDDNGYDDDDFNFNDGIGIPPQYGGDDDNDDGYNDDQDQDQDSDYRITNDIDIDDDDIDDSNNKSSNQPKTLILIYTDSMELAGNCIQSIGEHFQITNLPLKQARFPEEIDKLKKFVEKIEDIQSVRQHLTVEVADNANMIRAAVVQAEDARLTEEYVQMKQIYNDLAMLNRDIMREYKIRCQNHQDLVDNLKQINLIIQKASNLRIGTFKTQFVTTCREAIKQKNFNQLYKIINED